MQALSATAEAAYRAFVHDSPAMLRYFHAATPINDIGRLNIGSRPAAGSATNRINDLRAIPWVFAWTQSRAELPGWYGLGTALLAGQERTSCAGPLLRTMYREWPFFRDRD